MTLRIQLLATAALVGFIAPVVAQQDAATMLVTSQRSLVARAELTATLDSIDKVLKSGGYSQAFRDAKKSEADAIRQRLTDGDFHNGDPLFVTVIGGDELSKAYIVTPTRTLLMAGTIEISVKGVLRSEIESYLTNELKKYYRDPVVRVTPSMRIQLSGAVGHIGFFNVAAGAPLTDVLMNPSVGGGVAPNAKFEKSKVVRGEKEIIDGRTFKSALTNAKTLDELNLQAGDEIVVGTKAPGSLFTRIVGAAGALGGLLWLGIQIF